MLTGQKLRILKDLVLNSCNVLLHRVLTFILVLAQISFILT